MGDTIDSTMPRVAMATAVHAAAARTGIPATATGVVRIRAHYMRSHYTLQSLYASLREGDRLYATHADSDRTDLGSTQPAM
jgi:hypothetical protein